MDPTPKKKARTSKKVDKAGGDDDEDDDKEEEEESCDDEDDTGVDTGREKVPKPKTPSKSVSAPPPPPPSARLVRAESNPFSAHSPAMIPAEEYMTDTLRKIYEATHSNGDLRFAHKELAKTIEEDTDSPYGGSIYVDKTHLLTLVKGFDNMQELASKVEKRIPEIGVRTRSQTAYLASLPPSRPAPLLKLPATRATDGAHFQWAASSKKH